MYLSGKQKFIETQNTFGETFSEKFFGQNVLEILCVAADWNIDHIKKMSYIGKVNIKKRWLVKT